MEKTKTCEICSCEFTPYRKTQKYCSACKEIAVQRCKTAWYIKNNPKAYAPKEEKTCVVCGEPFRCHFEGLPYCNKHYLKMKFYGTTEKISKNTNKFIECDLHYEIITAKGDKVLVDKCDIHRVINISWCLDTRGYVVANINKKTTTIHRHILMLDGRENVVDHINGNRLDNRRSNLRVCTANQNAKNTRVKKNNTSGYPGIRKTKFGKFCVRITVNREYIHVGTCATIEEAIEKRKEAEIKYFGEYSPHLAVNSQLG